MEDFGTPLSVSGGSPLVPGNLAASIRTRLQRGDLEGAVRLYKEGRGTLGPLLWSAFDAFTPQERPVLAQLFVAVRDYAYAAGALDKLGRPQEAAPMYERAGDTFGLADGDVIAGVLAQNPVAFTEGGLSFEADVRAGQKTGHFLDQRANRMRVGELAAGCDVLDLFASTGGFTVHAAAGGATSVHSVDLSAPTLAATKRNLALNAHLPAVAACTTTTPAGNVDL